MNYFNPYFNYSLPSPRPSIFSFLKGARGINLSTILNGTQRTLGIINQAIPVIKQMQPMVRNAKTMFKVMNEFKKVDTPKQRNTNINNDIKENNIEEINYNENGPTFFI